MRKTTLLLAAGMSLLISLQSCSKKENPLKISGISSKDQPKRINGLGTALDQANVPNDVYALSSFSGSPKVMGSKDYSAVAGAEQEQKPYVENKGQDWILKKVNATDYIIIHRHSNQALTVANNVASENEKLILYPYISTITGQRWRIQWAGGFSVYTIRSVLNTNMGVHLASHANTDGIKFVLKTYGAVGVDPFQGYMAIQPVTYTTSQATFIGLPDTQSYADRDTAIVAFQEQITYILNNAASISMVLQHGDITNNNSADNWNRITPRIQQLNNVVPYALTTGNHDMSAGGTAADRITTNFNARFPYATMMKNLPCFGGIYSDPTGANKMDNSYYLIETGQYKWLILNLEFGPRDIVLTWAKSICDFFPDRTAIINTHSYMHYNNTRVNGISYPWNPHNYDLDGLGNQITDPTMVNDGQEMWDGLVKLTPNIRFVLSGHVLNDGCGTLMSTNNAGNNVYQMLANFQNGTITEGNRSYRRGGDGFLRKYIFNFSTGNHAVETRKAATNALFPYVMPNQVQVHTFPMTSAQLVAPLDELLTF